MIRTALIAGVVVAASLIQPAQAEASPLTCEHRSARHIAEHGGRLEDNRYHIAHGELPNCEEPEQAKPAPVPHNEDNKNNRNDDDKSRYCRKHFFC